MDNSSTRFTLRDLPLPAKLVATVFLMSVGLGYAWAMLQLHFKHAGKGSYVPGSTDVVERFSGVRPPWEPAEAVEPKPDDKKGGDKGPAKMVAGIKIKTLITERCTRCHTDGEEKADVPMEKWGDIAKLLEPSPGKSKFLKVIAKEAEGHDKDNMSEAFNKRSFVLMGKDDDGKPIYVEWKDMLKANKEMEAALLVERETERLALILWLESGASEEAFEKDAFPLSEELAKRPLTEYKTKALELPKNQNGAAAAVGGAAAVAKKKRNPKDRQLSVESLTQSTHAHLLSFAMLWALTGLLFAFTSYPLWMRAGIAPMVLIAQVTEICCWWLARLPDVGPYFAVAVMGLGGIVGLGLGAQIVLSLFNMYEGKGKAVLLVLFLIGGAGGGLVVTKYVVPMISAEKDGNAG